MVKNMEKMEKMKQKFDDFINNGGPTPSLAVSIAVLVDNMKKQTELLEKINDKQNSINDSVIAHRTASDSFLKGEAKTLISQVNLMSSLPVVIDNYCKQTNQTLEKYFKLIIMFIILLGALVGIKMVFPSV